MYYQFIYPSVSYPQYPYYPIPDTYYRQYPPVDPTLFNQSAITMQKLMRDASRLLDRLAQSKQFAEKIMSAAQESHTAEVKKLIESIGVQSKVDIYYDPDGIRITLSASVQQVQCCRLVIALRWKVF